MTKFCAICTKDNRALVQRQLGRGDAMVWICTGCDDEPIIATSGPDRGYEISERRALERPDAEAAARARNAPTSDPLAGIEKYQARGGGR